MSPPSPQPRFPVGPVWRLVRLAGLEHCDHRTLFDMLHRWTREGGIPLYSADRVAIALGHHPSELWPEWVDLV